MNENPESWVGAPAWIRAVAATRLGAGETPLTWFEPDLDAALHFSPGLVILTDRRLLSFTWQAGARPNSTPPPPVKSIEEWEIRADLRISTREHSGVGRLDLSGSAGSLATWRYTVTRTTAARRLAERLEALSHGLPPKASRRAHRPSVAECSVCGSPMAEDETTCAECGASKAKKAVWSLFRLFAVARKYVWMIVLGFLLTLATTASGLFPPYLTMPLIDDILVPYQNGQPVNGGMVRWYLAGLAAAIILEWAFTWAQMFVLSWVSERVAADLRNMTYSHLQRLSLEYFGGKRTGDLIARVSTDTDRICYFLSVYALDFITDVIMFFMTAGLLLRTDFGLAVVTLLPLPWIAFLVFRVQARLGRGFSLGNRAWAEMASVLADTIPGIRVVKAFAQEDREIARFRHANDRILQTNDRVNRLWAFFNAIVVLLTQLGILVVWMFGVYRVFHHSVKVGVLTAFVTLISRFYARLDSMSRMASATQRAAASAQRVFGILDRKPKVAEPKAPVPATAIKGGIELRHVSFRYGTRPILRDVNLDIRPGEMVGLVGQSGAGKTTVINLVCRFYDVTDGAILVDGVDIRQYAVGEFRRKVGLVLQEPFLFFGTIAENIAYGKAGATRREIIDAARAAHAHEFILRLPNGYDSLAGERGQFLSGGERQRISIARALLMDPRILILDEATSAVDTETEREIQLALANLTKGRTTIAIAHRLSTLQKADRIVVMSHGQIVEAGPHAQLLERGGAYARLYQAQIGAYGEEDSDDEPVQA